MSARSADAGRCRTRQLDRVHRPTGRSVRPALTSRRQNHPANGIQGLHIFDMSIYPMRTDTVTLEIAMRRRG